jgi:hypothetical protein
MNLTPDQLDTLRHMLGINTPNAPKPEPFRDYYCANPGDEKLAQIEALGAVECYSKHGGYWWYRCTDAGRAAAMASHKTIRKSKSSRVYSKYLDVSDVFPGLTFRRFITDPEFAQTRRSA